MLAAMGGAPSAPGSPPRCCWPGSASAWRTPRCRRRRSRPSSRATRASPSGLFSTGRYAGSIVAALLLALLLGDGGAHAGAFFALTAVAAGASALCALRLGGAPAVAAPVAGVLTGGPARGSRLG